MSAETNPPAESSASEAPTPETSSRWRLIGPIIIAATGLVIWAITAVPRNPPLPEYEYVVVATDADQRGEDPGVERVKVRQDSLISIQLRPHEPVEDPMEAALFLRAKNGIRRSSVSPEVSKKGAVRVRGRATDVFGATSGDFEAALVVCRTGHMRAAKDIFQDKTTVSDAKRVFPGESDASPAEATQDTPSNDNRDPHCWRAHYFAQLAAK